jgi:anti-sigma-K factor RskA
MSDLHKLTGAYAVDALDDLERARFEQHLDECDDCRFEVAELRETAALLADSVSISPPAALRDSVLAGIAQVRPLPPVVTPMPTATTLRRRLPLLVAAAAVLIVGLGAVVWQPWSEETPTRLTAAEQVLGAPDAQEVFLDLGDTGQATVTRSKSRDRAVIQTEDMSAAPEGKDYELWLLSPDGEFTSAGLMPDAADQTLVLDGAAADAAAVGITVEPDGGSIQPSSEPIALFDLTQAT